MVLVVIPLERHAMTPDEFKREWTAGGDALIPFSRDSRAGIGLSESTMQFLVEAGLPDSAAPFLDFIGHGSRRIQPASDAYPVTAGLARYRCVGTNDSGDPICIDTESNDTIVLLFHDDNFRPIRLNSTLERFAESLLAFRKLVDESCAINGDDAFLDGDIPQHLIESLSNQLSSIDAESMKEGDFWRTEIKTLVQNAL